MSLRFYTNVQMVGNNFLVRGYENGKSVIFKEEFSPTLFVKSNKETQYKTLEGENVEPIQPGTVKDCREFYKKYEDVEGFKIYGNDRYVFQYISEKYPEDEVKFDINLTMMMDCEFYFHAKKVFGDPIYYDDILVSNRVHSNQISQLHYKSDLHQQKMNKEVYFCRQKHK